MLVLPGRRRLSRRAVLRGTKVGLAATLGLPILDAMLDDHGTALAGGAPVPVRFGVFFWGNGVRLEQWVPQQIGANYPVTPLLQPLADAGVLPLVSIASGFVCPFGQEVVHDVGRAAVLSGSYDNGQPTVIGLGGNATERSLDRYAVDVLAEGTPFSSIEIGVSKAGFGLVPDINSVSWEEPVSPLPAEFSPATLYQRLFGDALAEVGFLDALQSVIDVVKEDAESLAAKLGAKDRARLEAHLDGLRDIEAQLVADPLACGSFDPPDALPEEVLGHEPLAERAKALADLLVVALSCDMTRVFNYRYQPAAGDTYFHPIGATEAHHVMSHDTAQQDGVAAIVGYIMGELGYFLAQLAAVEEGVGTLLDNTAVYCVSEVAVGRTHVTESMPILIAGRAGGTLQAGVHVRSPSGQSTSAIPLTLLRAIGVDIDNFGEGIGNTQEVVPGLLA